MNNESAQDWEGLSSRAGDSVHFSLPLAYGHDFPDPVFSMLPTEYGLEPGSRRSLPVGAEDLLHMSRARYGLGLLASSQLQEGDRVLLPAYHCPALVEPFVWAGCQIKFYPLDEYLNPVPADFERLLDRSRAVVLVRYFGFDKSIAENTKIAQDRGCLVIEDLAHAPFIRELYGDFGVTSLAKFYPVKAGSEIWAAQSSSIEALSENLQHISRRKYGGRLVSALQRVTEAARERLGRVAPQKGLPYFREEEFLRPPGRAAWREIARHSGDKIMSDRRRNYQLLDKLLHESKFGRPLHDGLGNEDVPYVYPYILKDTDSFGVIRSAGIPLYRWEELAPTGCSVSQHYRGHLIQLPCHQNLSPEDINLIARTFAQ